MPFLSLLDAGLPIELLLSQPLHFHLPVVVYDLGQDTALFLVICAPAHIGLWLDLLCLLCLVSSTDNLLGQRQG